MRRRMGSSPIYRTMSSGDNVFEYHHSILFSLGGVVMQMCPDCGKVYDESEYSKCPRCYPNQFRIASKNSLFSVIKRQSQSFAVKKSSK